MHADKDLFIRVYFILCATSINIYLPKPNILVATIRSRGSLIHTDKIIRPSIGVSSDACLIVSASCPPPELINPSNFCNERLGT